MTRIILCLSTILLCSNVLRADDGCDCKCNHCGCQSHCQKICHVICEMKDVKVVCYGCKEQDICIPGHSTKCGEVCEPNPCCLAHPDDCEACQNRSHGFLDGLCREPECEHRTLWEPACSGKIRSVNKLIKYEATKKVPTYKWVVEYCCDKCAADVNREQQNILAGQSSQSLLPPGATIQLTSGTLPPPAISPPQTALPFFKVMEEGPVAAKSNAASSTLLR